jgi:hypothetical protein
MPPLDAAACRPSVPDLGGREPYRLGTGGDWAPIFLEIERLRVASILEKETPGWQASIGALLERIDSVPQAPERSDIAHFIEKGNAYTRLLRMRMDPDPSPGTSANEGEYYADLAIRELRQELLAATIAFASSPYAIDVRRQSPASWFAVFNEQLRFVGQFDLDSTVDAAQLMQASEDPTVALYGHFLGPPSRLSAVTPVN